RKIEFSLPVDGKVQAVFLQMKRAVIAAAEIDDVNAVLIRYGVCDFWRDKRDKAGGEKRQSGADAECGQMAAHAGPSLKRTRENPTKIRYWRQTRDATERSRQTTKPTISFTSRIVLSATAPAFSAPATRTLRR